jgi:hypothetical protein
MDRQRERARARARERARERYFESRTTGKYGVHGGKKKKYRNISRVERACVSLTHERTRSLSQTFSLSHTFSLLPFFLIFSLSLPVNTELTDTSCRGAVDGLSTGKYG